MVLKANDRRHLALCHDEFRGPRSGLCRSAIRTRVHACLVLSPGATQDQTWGGADARGSKPSRWRGVVVWRGRLMCRSRHLTDVPRKEIRSQ
ncbi:hypothetical protein TNCV_4770621 [Trichonephila clavipes]|nr:hypothetical protein TNCV_4770621 [Trichonephila clavipes]